MENNSREHILQLKQKRIEENKKIQAEFDKLDTMQDKFMFIYDLLRENQLEFAKWNKTDYVFSPEYRQQLVEKSKNFAKKGDFINTFINDIQKPLGQGHCYLLERNVNEDFLTDKTYNTTEDNDNFEYEFLENNTLYMRFKSFSSANFEFDKQKAMQLKEILQHKNIQNVILDIRGNTGGTDSYLNVILKTLETKMKYSIQWYNTLFHEPENYEIEKNFGNKTYNYYVLTDNKTFSAAEIITRAFKQNGATIIGASTSTQGCAGISPELQIKILSYINTDEKDVNLICRIPINASANPQGEIDYNYTNTKPDIECTPNAALDIALEKIKAQQNFMLSK